jgi:uncharacterized protein (TIGR02171 family)
MRSRGRNTTKFLLIGPCAFLLIIACYKKHPTYLPSDPRFPGMIKVASAGKSFPQGWNDPAASVDEKPGMLSSFTYDYWLDSTEITQKHFYDVLGRQPVPDTSSYGVGDGYPVYFVSWFDAILFCNARSKAELLDTVYAYAGKKSLSNGCVYELIGLYGDLSRSGYRLPTESEWEYAARGASTSPLSPLSDSVSADDHAWYSGNAGGATHPVASKLPNSLGFYDMEGNVFEWTNDWKGSYDSAAMIDPLGASQPGNDCEKVIKGGSFNYDLTFLRPTVRGATYPGIPSSSCEYVGFRCARAAIPGGQYIGARGQTITPNPVLFLKDRSEMRSLLSALWARLAFVNVTNERRTLCIVDFSEIFLTVRQYTDDTDVYAPTISPNGCYVAYCSRNEGLPGPAKITVRAIYFFSSIPQTLPADSAYIPRWWIDPVSRDTFIIFTNSSITNASPLWRSTKTLKQKMSGGVPVGPPSEIIAEGSYHDGISVNGHFAITANTRLMTKDLITGEERQIFQPPFNGKDASGSTQVCNASISPDTGAMVRCMFLDFGYPKISSITGSPYGIHQYIFIATLHDSITQCIRVPDNENSWDNPEWSNAPGFTVASTRSLSDQAHALYCIDIKKNRCERIAEGVELQQPYLWIESVIPNPSGYPLDSIGRYDEPLGSEYQNQLASKLLLFWRRCDSLEVAIIGSSQAMQGIGPLGPKSFNFAAAGEGLLGQKNLIMNYLSLNCPRLKVVCSSLDIGWLGKNDGDFSWNSGIGQSSGYRYDSGHAFWSGGGGVAQEVKSVMCSLPPSYYYDTLLFGFCPSPCNNWGDPSPACVAFEAWTIDGDAASRNIETIAMLADSLRKKGVHWIMIDMPVSPHYKNSPNYSFWGPARQTALDVQRKMSDIEHANPYFHFYNANMNGNHDYSDDEAQDENHLCASGANKLTVRLDSLIRTLIPK